MCLIMIRHLDPIKYIIKYSCPQGRSREAETKTPTSKSGGEGLVKRLKLCHSGLQVGTDIDNLFSVALKVVQQDGRHGLRADGG